MALSHHPLRRFAGLMQRGCTSPPASALGVHQEPLSVGPYLWQEALRHPALARRGEDQFMGQASGALVDEEPHRRSDPVNSPRPLPGIARRAEPPVICTNAPPPACRRATAPAERNTKACSATATVQPRNASMSARASSPPPNGPLAGGRLALTALTTASSDPSSRRAVASASVNAPCSDASAGTARAPRPRTRSSVSSLRATAATFQPRPRKCSTIAPPRFRAPSTTNVCPMSAPFVHDRTLRYADGDRDPERD